jgi:hypothetical protein
LTHAQSLARTAFTRFFFLDRAPAEPVRGVSRLAFAPNL